MDSMRCAVALLLMGGGILPGQTTVPVTAPTALPSAVPAVLPAAVPGRLPNAGVDSIAATPAPANERHDAVVHFVGGKVEVVADGSSLNQILREIGRVTGMKITGGVADEPVYGRYGPASASDILSTLLDGTVSNILLREATAVGPGELILTPRTGGVTPPNPNAPAASAGYPQPNLPGARNYQRPREAWMNTTARDVANGVTPAGQQPANSVGRSGGSTARPDPQQIYEQLQQLQRTQQKPPQ